ncbi:MFS transporter [Swaminathania salitolerans]|uniref:MFS transporter n=1 Tax=Swaminathania salitolerans TaxID=182838 RepID=A0A511BNU5_9PROT|nr:MFS transporter [Swaminathania salitolerans]GBQ13769.1 arabinose efflux permease [Swaminathania salitolerans LMG 21291]GEL01742.1 MFS transporter [Swaminathania salitolerans]
MPWHALTILALAACVTLLTEIMPAGMLTSIGAGLGVPQSGAGQFITAFALGALLSALPCAALTREMGRKRLLLTGLAGFFVTDCGNALVTNLAASLVLRFLAGCAGGLIWGLFAGYAARLAPAPARGRAITIAGSGVTLALVLGAPLSALIGQVLGWRGVFAGVGISSGLLGLWAIAALPDVAGMRGGTRLDLLSVLRRPGIVAVLLVIFSYVTAHSLLYVYIEPLLAPSGLAHRVDGLLLVFGAGSVAGLILTGILIDRYLAGLGTIGILMLILATALLAAALSEAQVVCFAVVLWGMSSGGFAAITQSAMAHISGDAMDVAQGMATTAWNGAVSLGGIIGGLLLAHQDVGYFPAVALGLAAIAMIAFRGIIAPRLVH